MKKIVLSGLLSLALMAFSSDAMKRELSSDESVEKEEKIKKYTPEEFEQAMAWYDKEEDKKYPNEFYYVPGVSRELALEYCWKICKMRKEFQRAWGYINHNKNQDSPVKRFLSRYSQAVITRAAGLREPNLKENEVGYELPKAIQAIEADGAELSYLATGKRNNPPFTQELWQNHWKMIKKASFIMDEYNAVAH